LEKRFKILVVDDDVGLALNLQDILEAEGYTAAVVHDGQTALTIFHEKAFDLAVVDIKLPDILGLELINELAKISIRTLYIIITGYASLENAIEAVKTEKVVAFETKPIDMDHFMALIKQVAERKRVEEKLRESEERFRALIENSSDIIQIVDSEGVIRYVSPSIERILGYRPEEATGRLSVDFVHPDDLPIVAKGFEKAIQEPNVPVITECRCKHKDGTWRVIRGIGVNRLDEPSLRGFVSNMRDVTEHKQAEEAIRKSEEKYRELADFLPQIVFETDERGNLKFSNRYAFQSFGYTLEDYDKGLNTIQMLIPEERDRASENIQRVLNGEEPSGIEYMALRKDGSTFPVIIYSTPIIRKNKAVGLRGIMIDITERKQAEEKVKYAAEEWRTTFDSIADLVSIHDKDFRLIRVNKAFADTFKMKPAELIGKPCYEIVHGTSEPVPNCPHIATIETKKPATVEFLEPHLGIHLEVSTSPIFNEEGDVVAAVHITRDITERKDEQEKLMLTDRLASVGELASGIAHELNNPLTSVIGFAQLLMERDISDDIRDDLKTIYSEARRTAEVVQNLLTFARKHPPVKQPVNINSIIEKVLEVRDYEQRVSNIQVNTHFAPDLPEVMADYFQLQQVFVNIVINAEHFMIEAHNRGTLTITTERTGEIVRVSFADDGPGIVKENLRHLFDPFFTTKEVGKGTGLGLSICHGITSRHGGTIYAESELGKGATFIVELPVNIAD
jgi:PAS domain S-box-containing protein